VVEIPENWVSICEDEVISGSTTLYRLYQSSSFEIHRNDNAIDLQRTSRPHVRTVVAQFKFQPRRRS